MLAYRHAPLWTAILTLAVGWEVNVASPRRPQLVDVPLSVLHRVGPGEVAVAQPRHLAVGVARAGVGEHLRTRTYEIYHTVNRLRQIFPV